MIIEGGQEQDARNVRLRVADSRTIRGLSFLKESRQKFLIKGREVELKSRLCDKP